MEKKVDSEKNLVPLDPNIHLALTCHYDHQTLLTRNGELVQLIKVKGWKHYNEGREDTDNLRDMVRRAVISHVPNNDFVIQFFIIRDIGDITPEENETSLETNKSLQALISSKIKEEYYSQNNLHNTLCNTLYIAITHRANKNKIGASQIQKNFVYSAVKLLFFKNIEKIVPILTSITNKIAQELKKYGSSILTLKTNSQGHYISEPLSFMRYLVRMSQENVLLDTSSASEQICDNIHIGFDEKRNILVKNPEKTKYVSIFTLTNSANLNAFTAEQILQIRCKIIISETIELVKGKEAMSFWSPHIEIAEKSKASELVDIGGLKTITNMDAGSSNNFCKQQVVFQIHGENEEELTDNIKRFTETAKKIGLSIIREDIGAYSLIWSQYPGNMHLSNRRSKYNITANTALFTNTWPRNIGCRFKLQWGSPIMLLTNIKNNTPYYFHFHNYKNDECHNLIIANRENCGSDSILIKNIMIGALAVKPKIINFDLSGTTTAFMKDIGAKSLELGKDYRVNLFEIADGLYPGQDITDEIIQFVEHMASANDYVDIEITKNEEIEIKTYSENGENTEQEKSEFQNADTANIKNEKQIKLKKYWYKNLSDIIKQSFAINSVGALHQASTTFSKRIEDMVLTTENKETEKNRIVESWLKSPSTATVFGESNTGELEAALPQEKMINLDLLSLFKESKVNCYIMAVILIIKIVNSLPGNKPTMIIINNADFLLELPPLLTAIFCKILDICKKKNIVFTMSINQRDHSLRFVQAWNILPCFHNFFIATDRWITREHRKILNLSNEEIYDIRKYTREKNMFLFKKGEENMIVQAFEHQEELTKKIKKLFCDQTQS